MKLMFGCDDALSRRRTNDNPPARTGTGGSTVLRVRGRRHEPQTSERTRTARGQPAAEKRKHENLAPSRCLEANAIRLHSGHEGIESMRRQCAQRKRVARIRRRGDGEVGRAGCSGRKGEARPKRGNRRRRGHLKRQRRHFRSERRRRNTVRRCRIWILGHHESQAKPSVQPGSACKRLNPSLTRNA